MFVKMYLAGTGLRFHGVEGVADMIGRDLSCNLTLKHEYFEQEIFLVEINPTKGGPEVKEKNVLQTFLKMGVDAEILEEAPAT